MKNVMDIDGLNKIDTSEVTSMLRLSDIIDIRHHQVALDVPP